ncbi:unnamed protein product, partial [Timema podura]|nr:unnamed protein product [Timema podura]
FSDRDVKEDVVNGDSKGIELKAITYKDPEKGDLEKGADINLFEKADFEKAIELTGKSHVLDKGHAHVKERVLTGLNQLSLDRFRRTYLHYIETFEEVTVPPLHSYWLEVLPEKLMTEVGVNIEVQKLAEKSK